MAWQDAKAEGEKWAAENLPAELRGHVLQLVKFEDPQDCRFFYPDRPAEFHAMITVAVARIARKRHAKIVYVTLKPSAYSSYIEVQGLRDTHEERFSYAEGMHMISAKA